MTTLDHEALEAAIEGIWNAEVAAETDEYLRHILTTGHYVGSMQYDEAKLQATAAITAFIQHIEPELRKRVGQLVDSAGFSGLYYGKDHGEYWLEKRDEDRADLFALFGLERE